MATGEWVTTDNGFKIIDETDETKAVQFQVSTVTPGATRIFSVPDADGNIITSTSAEFSDAQFALQDDGDPTKVAKFQVSGLTTGTTRTYTFPDASGTISLGSGVGVFPDDTFQLIDNVDNTKIAVFECSGITTGTTRTFTFPDANGTIALVGAGSSQFMDGSFEIQNSIDNTKVATFDSSGITTATTRSYAFPDDDGTLLIVDSGGIVEPDTTVKFKDDNFEVVDDGDNTKVAKFQASNITTATTRTLALPNESGTLALNRLDDAMLVSKSSTLGDQSIPTSTTTVITFDTVNVWTYDNGSHFSSNTTYTTAKAGYYFIYGTISWDGIEKETYRLSALIDGSVEHRLGGENSGEVGDLHTSGTVTLSLTASQTIQLAGFTTESPGTVIDCTATLNETFFGVLYLGPDPF